MLSNDEAFGLKLNIDRFLSVLRKSLFCLFFQRKIRKTLLCISKSTQICRAMKTAPPLFNFYEAIREDPVYYRQFVCNDLLITEYNCPLESRIQALWSQYNYFVYVLEGKKAWHTPESAFVLKKDHCIFVRKGAAIVEQFFDATFCVMIFFVPDDFIRETLRPRLMPSQQVSTDSAPIMPMESDATLSAFFYSMLPYFSRMQPPDNTLLELKFRELLLNIVDNPKNRGLLAYACSLLQEAPGALLKQVMEDNFCYNLSLEEYAQLCNRSLSAFKRDFQKIYQNTPGKWLMDSRLEYAKMQLLNPEKTVSEVAYSSGFENLSHFSRAFRDKFGASPAAMRLQNAS
jgi:AraC family transcriptional regulator, exoenzyme S synthesis regulatory protein ExsA